MGELKKTKILCTIGPASFMEKVLRAMREAGMDGARINTAYGDTDQYRNVIAGVRRIGDIPILFDLKGPELRVHTTRQLTAKEGDHLKIGEGMDISFNHPVYDQFRVSDKILFDDAKIETEVLESEDDCLNLLVKTGGLLEDGKGVNCPGRHLDVPTLSDRDLEVIEFAKKQDVDFLGLSFTRDANDVRNLKKEIEDTELGIVAKIENNEGVNDFDRILAEADGIMVARGDLGIEVEQEKVPLLQKHMIATCNQLGKIVITATEMLESMTENPKPTRAEVSDVANAILDGTDVVMLSGETATGKYPVEAVATMAKIARQTEEAVVCKVEEEKYQNISNAISWSVSDISRSMPLDKVVTITRTGYTAKAIGRFKLKQPIIAVTGDPSVKRKLELVYGVNPVHFKYKNGEDRILSISQTLLSEKMVSEDDVVLFTAAFRTSQRHSSNLIEIHKIKELMEFMDHQGQAF
jgi:pyruvate kinase